MAYKLSSFREKYAIPDCIILCDKNSKRPLNTDWVNTRPHLSPEQLDSPSHNKGLVLLDKFAVLDVDDYAKAEKFFSLHGLDLAAVKSNPALFVYGNTGPSSAGKGKFKVLFRMPVDAPLPKYSYSAEHGVEFRSGECQDILPGSIHPDGGEYTVFNEPEQLLELHGAVLHLWRKLYRDDMKARTLQGLAEKKAHDRIPNQQMTAMLAHLPPEWVDDYEQWWKVGAALQRAEYSYEMWAEWSSKSPKWNANAALRKWNTSFGGDNARAPFTIASIIAAARTNGYNDSDISDLLSGTVPAGKAGQPFYEGESVDGEPEPDDSDIPPLDAPLVVKERVDAYKLVQDEFIYIGTQREFFHLPSGMTYPALAFAPAIAHHVLDVPDPANPGSFKEFNFIPILKAPGKYMRTAQNYGFVPGGPLITTMTTDEGTHSVLNGCRYDYAKLEIAPPSPDTKRILDGLFDHFTENQSNAECTKVLEHMLRSLHYKMKNPAVRFDYAHLLISRKGGTGKSFFTTALPWAIFGTYAVSITNEQLESQFTEYKQKAIIVSVEELKVGGNNFDRMDMRDTNKFMNKLKDWVTSSTTSVNIKGKSAYKILNPVMLLATSNHIDCIPPASAEDRRWLACVSKAGDITQENPELSRECFALFRDKSKLPEIRGWVQTFSAAGVNPSRLPFFTDAVANMAELDESPLSTTVVNLFGPGRDPSLPDVLTQEHLVAEVRDAHGDPNIRWGRSLKMALSDAGIEPKAGKRSAVAKWKIHGNRVVVSHIAIRYTVFILRNAAKYKECSDTEIVKLALEATTGANRLSLVP